MNLPLSTAFTVSHRFWVVVFSFSFISMHILIFFPQVFFSPFIFISWRLITLQYCSGFCHTLTWISHGFTFIPHPNPPFHLPLHSIPLGLPSAPGLSTCLIISFLISSIICWLSRSVLFNLHMFGIFHNFFSCIWDLILLHCGQKR